MTVMVYKKDGNVKLHGLMCDYKIVEEAEVAQAMKDGWAASPAEAHKKRKPRKPKEE